MKTIVLATRNKHKVEEIKHLLDGDGLEVLCVADFKNVPEVVEDGSTLEVNAIKKAKSVALVLKQWTLADDTGLEVLSLGGAPGVYSARFAGEDCSYDDNNKKLLRLLKDSPLKNRKARFRCVIAVASPTGKVYTVDGSISGIIAKERKGKKGFGYDPIFYVPRYKKTFAELDMKTKNHVSHRGKALIKAKKLIKSIHQQSAGG